MKLLLTLLALTSLNLSAQDIQTQKYKNGIITCSGNSIGAERINVYQDFNDDYVLEVLDQNNSITMHKKLGNKVFINLDQYKVWFEYLDNSTDQEITLYQEGQFNSVLLKISTSNNDLGSNSNKINFSSRSYFCSKFVIAQ